MGNLRIVQPCGENGQNGGDGENEKGTGRTRRSGENEKDYFLKRVTMTIHNILCFVLYHVRLSPHVNCRLVDVLVKDYLGQGGACGGTPHA